MKNILKYLIPGCLILIGCNEQTQTNKIKSEYAAIDFFTPSGWSLVIKQDGSGQVGFGSHATDFAEFEKNTFNFSDVMKQLESKLESEGSISTKIAVNLWEMDETSINVLYTSDKSLVNNFFQKALSAITNNKERLEEIYKDKKPLSIE
jgi:hypothetical protein